MQAKYIDKTSVSIVVPRSWLSNYRYSTRTSGEVEGLPIMDKPRSALYCS